MIYSLKSSKNICLQTSKSYTNALILLEKYNHLTHNRKKHVDNLTCLESTLNVSFISCLHLDKIKNPAESVRIPRDLLEATTRFELVITVLQTDALPLGYVALQNAFAL